MGKPSAFSVVLMFCGLLLAFAFLGNFYLITHDYPQFDAAMWAVLGGSVIGEVVTFSLYRMAKEKDRRKGSRGASIPASMKAKHAVIQDMEDEGNDEQADQ